MKWLLTFSLLIVAASASGAERDLFEGVFGQPTFSSRRSIPGRPHERLIGYTVTGRLPPLGDAGPDYRSALLQVASRHLRLEGFAILRTRALTMDDHLPATCHVLASRDGRKFLFSLVVFDGGPDGCFFTYEFRDDA